jgi:tetratricopeptide (TPR) repeat protein
MEMSVAEALQKAISSHEAGALQEAADLYRAILKKQPNHPDANHNLGVLAISIGRAAEALPLLKVALESNSRIQQFWLSYLHALLQEREFVLAAEVLRDARRAGVPPERLQPFLTQIDKEQQLDIDLVTEMERLSTENNQADKNAEQYTEMQQGPLAMAAFERKQRFFVDHYKAGQFQEAEDAASSFIDEFPNHMFGWKALGAVLKHTGRLTESLEAMQKAVELAPADAESHSNLGGIFRALNRLDEAQASYRTAILLEPGYASAHSSLGDTLAKLGKLDEAEESYRQVISIEPHNAEAHSDLGVTLSRLGKPEEAVISLGEALALKPNLASAHNSLGNIQKKLGKLDAAEASYTEAIRLDPDYVEALLNRSQLYFDRELFDSALNDLDRCNVSEARARSCETLYALGRYDEIYTRIEQYADLEDSNIKLAALSAFISAKLGKSTAHRFCQDPLSFLYFSNMTPHVENAHDFVTQLINELQCLETIWEPENKTTTNGFQLPSSLNLFEQPGGRVASLKTIILNEVGKYYAKFQDRPCSFIERWPTKKRLFGWHVVLKRQGYQGSHFHPSGWLSGVVYLKVAPSAGKSEGAIEFSLNSTYYSDQNSPNVVYQPILGDIVLFPSSLPHRTLPFSADVDRIVVAFDLLPDSRPV